MRKPVKRPKNLLDKIDKNLTDQIVKVDAKQASESSGALQSEYSKHKMNAANAVNSILESSKIVKAPILHGEDPNKSIMSQKSLEKENVQDNLKQPTSVQKILNEIEEEEKKRQEMKKIADGIQRSKRSIAMRVQDTTDAKLDEIEREKTNILLKLNEALMKLDKLNTNKREMSNKLVEQIKFTRDLERAVLHGDDIEGIVSEKMKADYRREKEYNEQLKIQIKRVEEERLKLIDRIKLLSGDKQVVVTECSGIQKTYEVTTVNVSQLLDDIRCFRSEIVQNEGIFERTRALMLRCEEDLCVQERKVGNMFMERDKLHQQSLELSIKYDDTMISFESERERIKHAHRLHQKLLGMRQVQESLQAILRRNTQTSFDHLQRTTDDIKLQRRASQIFKKILQGSDKAKLKNFLMRWYNNTLEPSKQRKIKRNTPGLYSKRKVWSHFFNKWRVAYKNKLAENLNDKQKIKKALQVFTDFQNRQKKYAILIWREKLRTKQEGMKLLGRVTFGNQRAKKMKAFYKWYDLCQVQNYHIRIRGLQVHHIQKMMLTSYFAGWRTVIQGFKMKKRSSMVRVFKAWKSIVKNKLDKLGALQGCLGGNKKNKKGLKQKVFNGFKLYKMQQNFKRDQDFLNNSVKKDISNLTLENKNKQLKTERQVNHRILEAFQGTLIRRFKQYFTHWSTITKQDRFKKFTVVARQVIRLYNMKMQLAFKAWQEGRNYFIIKAQEQENNLLEARINKYKMCAKRRDIAIAQVDQQFRSRAAMALIRFYRKFEHDGTKRAWQVWISHCIFKADQQDAMKLIAKRWQNHALWACFKKWCRGVAVDRMEKGNELKILTVKDRLVLNKKKRTYLAFKAFTQAYISAKVNLRTLMKKRDNIRKRGAFAIWVGQKDANITFCLQMESSGISQLCSKEKGQLGKLQSKRTEIRDENKRMASWLLERGRKLMVKYLTRAIHASVQDGFKNWASLLKHTKRKERVFNNFRKKFAEKMLANAMLKWKRLLHDERVEYLNQEITFSTRETEDAQGMIKRSTEQHIVTKDRATRSINKYDQEINYTAAKRENFIMAIIGKVDNNHYVTKLQNIWTKWRQYTIKRKNSCRLLEVAITRTLQKDAFDIIRHTARKDLLFERENRAATLFIKLRDKAFKRSAWDQWKKARREIVVSFNNVVAKSYEVKSSRHRHRVKKIKDQRLNQKLHHDNKEELKACFGALLWYCNRKKQIKATQQQLIEHNHDYMIKRAISRWNMRVKYTRMKKNKTLRSFKANEKQIKQRVFDTFKREHFGTRKATKAIFEACSSIHFQRLEGGFQTLKKLFEIKKNSLALGKKKGTEWFAERLHEMWLKRMQRNFMLLRSLGEQNFKGRSKLNQILLHMCANRKRSAFQLWKHKSEQAMIYEDNEHWSGPASLKRWNLRLEVINLSHLMRHDGMPDDQVEKFKKRVNIQSKKLMEKYVCRIICKGYPDLNHKAIFYDRWRAYTRKRQIWKYQLDYCRKKIERNKYLDGITVAFNKMKNQNYLRRKDLWGQTMHALVWKSIKNYHKLTVQNRDGKNKQKTIDEYTGQRNHLLRGYISGQKLALSSCHDNQWRAKFKTLNNLADHSHNSLTSQMKNAVQLNVAKIQELKDRIAKFEYQNEDITNQNDIFRKGAVEAVNMHTTVDCLNIERDRCTNDIADKSEILRKLLEDNETLTREVKLTEGRLTDLNMKRASIIADTKYKIRRNSQHRNSEAPYSFADSLQQSSQFKVMPERDTLKSNSPLRDRSAHFAQE